ncbi:DUF1003 domain-containing protein [Paracoccus limosus]|uniref:DUF1003 domain-containing protein n=1 Tax=Paracoccus limosus TaxID=913252 RepID=A0A844GWG1_9RHOB|nr:DUF1003 domain-containing protein [Paracoccus limosus]MTH32999.1 DUF1003 domain-containing protein [Paracoccus limosus]
MSQTDPHPPYCAVCGQPCGAEGLAVAGLRPSLAALIRRDRPDLPADGSICQADLERYRQLYLTELLADETGEVGTLEAEVAAALSRGALLTPQTAPDDFEMPPGFGARMADRVAEWGGSWAFILAFVGVLVGWVIVNTLTYLGRPFDPYPFILLNLILSCVAALQAPIIMMSQRRQEDKDRRRAENDYRINLKAELELRQLHEKLDHQLTHQWQRLLEIQRIQIDLINELHPRGGGKE